MVTETSHVASAAKRGLAHILLSGWSHLQVELLASGSWLNKFPLLKLYPMMLCYLVLGKHYCFSKWVSKALSSFITASLRLNVFHFGIYTSPRSQALREPISKSSTKYKNKTKEPISRLLTEVCLWFLHKQVNIWIKVFIVNLLCHNVIVYKK